MDEETTPKPKPAPKPKAVKKPEPEVVAPIVYDAVLDDATIAQVEADNDMLAAIAEDIIAADDTNVIEEVVAPVVPAAKSDAPPASPYAVVSGKATDNISLSSIVFKNIHAKKSLSVHHLQRRLSEWGYHEAYTDRDGWYGDLTLSAVNKFQADHGLTVGALDMPTLVAIFEGDNNVTLSD